MNVTVCRYWDKVYVVLDGASLSCYKDQKHAKQVSDTRNSIPIDNHNMNCRCMTIQMSMNL